MLTISPRHGALKQIIGATVRFDDGDVWSSDYYAMRAADGSVRFEIKNTFLSGADIVIDGARKPLLRYRGFLGRHAVLHIGPSEVRIVEERSPASVRFSLGRWSAEFDESSCAMTVDVKRDEPDFPFLLAGAHQLWASHIGS